MNNTSKTVPVSGTNAAKPVSTAENVTSINARTASLLAAHLKSMKNALTSSKHGSSFPLNLSCDGKETVNFETTSTTLSNGSQHDFVMLLDTLVIMNMNCEVMYWLLATYVTHCSSLFDVLFTCKNDLECVETRIWGKF